MGTNKTAQDGITLLNTIRNISRKKYGGANATTILNLVQMDKEMFLVYQAPTEPLSSYLSRFKGAFNVVELLEGSPWSHPAATKIVYNKLFQPTNYITDTTRNSADYQAAVANSQSRYLAALFFHGFSNKTEKELKK